MQWIADKCNAKNIQKDYIVTGDCVYNGDGVVGSWSENGFDEHVASAL